jgi:glycosyltransferase involved in cell wall biosynthesis
LLLNTDPAGFIFYSARFTINQIQKRFSIRPRRAASRHNSYLIAATEDDRRLIKRYWNRESALIPEVGQELTPVAFPPIRVDGEPLRFVWSGEHTAGKALNILLNGLRYAPPEIQWQLSILGSGRMTEIWKALAEEYGISGKCIWHGWLKKADAHEIMKQSHVLCITSIKDLTSTVTMEGLSFGLPVICINHCGFGNVVNESCGIKIPVDYPSKLSSGFLTALTSLFSDETYRMKLAYGALSRVADFSWDKKAEEINRIYNHLISSVK